MCNHCVTGSTLSVLTRNRIALSWVTTDHIICTQSPAIGYRYPSSNWGCSYYCFHVAWNPPPSPPPPPPPPRVGGGGGGLADPSLKVRTNNHFIKYYSASQFCLSGTCISLPGPTFSHWKQSHLLNWIRVGGCSNIRWEVSLNWEKIGLRGGGSLIFLTSPTHLAHDTNRWGFALQWRSLPEVSSYSTYSTVFVPIPWKSYGLTDG